MTIKSKTYRLGYVLTSNPQMIGEIPGVSVFGAIETDDKTRLLLCEHDDFSVSTPGQGLPLYEPKPDMAGFRQIGVSRLNLTESKNQISVVVCVYILTALAILAVPLLFF